LVKLSSEKAKEEIWRKYHKDQLDDGVDVKNYDECGTPIVALLKL
jgi:hypothetical protein